MESPAASLPVELLLNILGRITAVDFIRCGAVCRSWLSAIALFRASSQGLGPPLKPQFPWLMLSDPENPQSRYFYSFPDRKALHFHLPQIAGHRIVGSSSGFLITADAFSDLHALKPLTGSYIPLPPAAALPWVAAVGHNSRGKITKYLLCHGENGQIRIRTVYVDPTLALFYRKTIVCRSSRAVAVICAYRQQLAFAWLGDRSWTALNVEVTFDVSDLLFHKDKLFATDFLGRLMTFDLNRPSDPPVVFIHNHPELAPAGIKYLVESPDGDDLFLICRHNWWGFRLGRTTDFSVFKLDNGSEHNWLEVSGVGGLLLFLGFNGSIAFSSSDLSDRRSNVICYTQSLSTPDASTGDASMFDFEARTHKPLNLGSENQQLNGSPHMWFSPVLF